MNPDWFITIVFVTWAVWTAAGVGVLIRASVGMSREPHRGDEPRPPGSTAPASVDPDGSVGE